jgi:hypothetical protein
VTLGILDGRFLHSVLKLNCPSQAPPLRGGCSPMVLPHCFARFGFGSNLNKIVKSPCKLVGAESLQSQFANHRIVYLAVSMWCAILNSNYEMGRQNAAAECTNSHFALCPPSIPSPLWHHDTTDTRPHGRRGTSQLCALPNRAQRGPTRNHALRSAGVRCFNPRFCSAEATLSRTHLFLFPLE